ncbi:MAG: PriCT-2 domain-containing protein [Mariniphaga sp.]|nr:PriCT-2 domain-containing protein [Mariniphaga sp.]
MKLRFEVEIWLVERRKFNLDKWLKKQKPQKKVQEPATDEMKGPVRIQHEVEVITRRIENSRLDLTCNYQDWLKLGFSFADEFGPAGRSYFQRISKFHPEYDPSKCDEQYDKCLKRGKSGISIKTFFAAARDAGVNIRV